MAAQLFEALAASGFDLFLDNHGVLRPGKPFQEILWHRLADTDVAPLLDSPDFLASRWTEEEPARANASNIQVLQVLWPGQTEAAVAAFSTFNPLESQDFEQTEFLGPAARLQDTSIAAVVDAVEELRARAIGVRHAFLVREFLLDARNAGLSVHSTVDGALNLSAPRGRRILIQPTIGIPDAERYEFLEDLLQQRQVWGGITFHRQFCSMIKRGYASDGLIT